MKTLIFDEKQQQEQQQQQNGKKMYVNNVALFSVNSSHWSVMQHAPNFRDTGGK